MHRRTHAAFLSTQCRANDRNARAMSSSPESTRGTGSRWVSAMPPRYRGDRIGTAPAMPILLLIAGFGRHWLGRRGS